MKAEDYKISMKLSRKITDNLIDLLKNHLVDFGGNKVNTIYNIGNGNFNNNSGIRINEDHINIINNDDELEIDTKTKKGKNYNLVKKIIIKLFSKGE